MKRCRLLFPPVSSPVFHGGGSGGSAAVQGTDGTLQGGRVELTAHEHAFSLGGASAEGSR